MTAAPQALELAALACRLAEGDEADAFAHRERSGLARFAASEVHQPTLVSDASVTVRVVRDGRVGAASTNRTDEEGLGAAARRAGAAADGARPDPGFPGLAPPAAPPEVAGWDAETATLGPADVAERAWSAIAAAEGDVGLYGYFTSGETELAVASTTGVEVSQAVTDTTLLALAAGDGRSGYADGTSWRAADLDVAGLARAAAETAGRTAGATAVEPGTYRALLAPAAFGELLSFFGFSSLGALALLEGRSYLAGRLGERTFDERFTLRDDGTDRRGLPKAFDFEGVPKRPVAIVEGGVPRDVVWDRRTGKRGGRESTGHGLDATAQAHGPLPFNLAVEPGSAGDDDLVAAVDDGIYVTRLHYVNVVDAREAIFTGMTRDGTFRIEGGRVTRPLVNLRFTTSLPELVRDLLGLGSDLRLVNASDFYGARYPYGTLVPAVATGSFTITGAGSAPGL